MRDAIQSVYAGRDAELGRARSALERAFRGTGQTLAVTGEQGIGKSVLLERVAEFARDMGGVVLSGRCYEEQGSPAYWPWNEVIRSHLQSLDDVEAAKLYPDADGRMAAVLPSLRARLPGSAKSLISDVTAD